MTARDLFGNPLPATSGEIIRAFVAAASRQPQTFNGFRARNGIANVPRHIGGLVRAACERAGLSKVGTETATAAASRSRLCQTWGRA